MFALLLTLMACHNDAVDDSAAATMRPAAGHWGIVNTVTDDPCGMSTGWTTADTGGDGFTLAWQTEANFTVTMDEAGEGQEPVTLACLLDDTDAFTCDPHPVKSPIDGIDASIVVTEDTAGQFGSPSTAQGWTTLTVGADCAVVTDTMPLPCLVDLELSAQAD